MILSPSAWLTLGICIFATAGVLARPFGVPESAWVVGGAAALLVFGLLPPDAALTAVARGGNVYLFLGGMMLLSEIARRAGVFDWLAAHAARHAKGSPARLFTLVFAIGTMVTMVLSNDATAVVLTPAVYAVVRTARARPRPLLFACAMIANAASFLLPISNPANLVLYDGHMPSLLQWGASFALPAMLAIAGTYILLRLTHRADLAGTCRADAPLPALSLGGRIAVGGIVATAILLLTISALGRQLGPPTAIAGALTAALVLLRDRNAPWGLLRGISWGVLPLVAGLFVMVEAVNRTHLTQALATLLHNWSQAAPLQAAAGAGLAVALADNLMNNLPAGLFASTVIAQAHTTRKVTDCLLIGVDLGPNLSITGSLATILWLTAIRREGENVSFLDFLKVGALVMPPALLLAIGARLAVG